MRCRADIQDARRRIEDAANVFRLQSRVAGEGFEELSSNWADTRGRRFLSLHVQPQTEMMEKGHAFWREASTSAVASEQSVEEAERCLQQAYAFEQDFEHEKEATIRLVRTTEELAAHALAEASRLAFEAEELSAAIASAAHDPGW